MSYYINQKCGSCKRSLTGGYVSNYSGIGQPFLPCDKCGSINIIADNITEWKLKSLFSKTFFVFHHVLSIVIYYGFGAGLFGVVIMAMEDIVSIAVLIVIVGCNSMIFSNVDSTLMALIVYD